MICHDLLYFQTDENQSCFSRDGPNKICEVQAHLLGCGRLEPRIAFSSACLAQQSKLFM